MKRLYVLYDAECELCVHCRDWLMKQPAFVPLVFVALQSAEAHRRFPGVEALRPNEQLLVISNEGAVYRGPCAWIMCLWALKDYRLHAQRLAHPILLPFARVACQLLSRNRFFISRALFRRDPQTVARVLSAHCSQQPVACSSPTARP